MKGTPVGNDRRGRAARAAVGTAVAAVTLAASGQAEAKDLEVTNTRASGDGSFMDAFKAAESDGDQDTITFAKDLRGTIKLRGRSLRAEEPLVIAGRGYGNRRGRSFGRVTIAGHRRGTSFFLDGFMKKGVANSIREVKLERIAVASAGPPLTVKDSYLDGDTSVDQDIAGVDAQFVYGSGPDALRVLDTTVTGFDNGVGITRSHARIDSSRISGNLGEGIRSGEYASFEVTNSTISGNGGYGARSVYESDGDVINSTITGNGAGGTLGVDAYESTIAENGGPGFSGYQYEPDAQLSNSIVWGNAGSDCAENVDSLGGNLIGDPGECATQPTDLIGADPKLGKLASNGGPTRTMALGKGSPAVGLAVRKTATKFDQRGVRRDKDPDAGAYER